MTTLSLTERLNAYGERISSEQGDTLFLPQTALQHFPELGDGTSMQAYVQLATRANSKIIPYEVSGGGITTRFCYLPIGKARAVSFRSHVVELGLDFTQRLELEDILKQKATV